MEADALGGTDGADLPEWARRRAPELAAIEIGPDEVEAVALYMALDTQWRWHPTAGVRLGLVYEAVAPAAAAMGLTMTTSLFNDLRSMESAAIAASADRRG